MSQKTNTLLAILLLFGAFTSIDAQAAPSVESYTYEMPWDDIDTSQFETNESLTIAQFIPLDLRPTKDLAEISEKILNHTLEGFSKSEAFNSTALGRTTNKVTNTVSPEINLLSEEDSEQEPKLFIEEEEESIHHTFRLKLDAPVATASLVYSGYLDFDATYKSLDGELDLSISKSLGQTASLELTHNTRASESLLQLQLAW